MTDVEQLSFAEQQVLDAFGRTNERGEFLYSTDEAIAGVVFCVVTLASADQIDLTALPESLDNIFKLYFGKAGIASEDPEELLAALRKQLLTDLSPEFVHDLSEAVQAIARQESEDGAEALARAASAVVKASEGALRSPPTAGLQAPSGGVGVRGKKR